MGNLINFKEIVKSKILRNHPKNEKMKNKMPSIINDIIKSNLDTTPEKQENDCNHVDESQDTSYKHIYRYKKLFTYS